MSAIITIDPAGAADRAGWRALWSGYCSFYGVPDTDEKADTVWAWIRDPDHPVNAFVARDGHGRVVGFTHYRPYPRPIAGGYGCFLDDLFVAPDARGGGVAERLILMVAEEARTHGWPVIRWITAEDNARARALYDRVSARTHWVTYEIKG